MKNLRQRAFTMRRHFNTHQGNLNEAHGYIANKAGLTVLDVLTALQNGVHAGLDKVHGINSAVLLNDWENQFYIRESA